MIFESRSAADTESFAMKLASRLLPGDVIRLHGEIGVGKTVFVRGVARFFGCEQEVCSPTFAIMNIYAGSTPVYHFDLYRLESEDEIYEAGLYEYLGADGIALVEWPELLREYPSKRIYDVTIEKNNGISEDYRKITLEGEGFEDTCC